MSGREAQRKQVIKSPPNRKTYGFQENFAPQGLKKPPTEIGVDEDSGEWTRGGGTDPIEPPREGEAP